jgi:2-C-methyl-D-erythritol 4-phosphate cytidylyltransferase
MLKDMKRAKHSAIIVAAGAGSRFGSDTPKQFLHLRGREVLSYSIESFLQHPEIDELIVVTSSPFRSHVSKTYPQCKVVLGGATRQKSVGSGLDACDPDCHIVLVHDAARPLIPTSVIDACLDALSEFDGVAPAIPPVDSMVLLEGGGFRNLNRQHLRIIQTPQCFKVDVLRKAHASGLVDTDELGLVRRSVPEARLTLVAGDPQTMKLTCQEDFDRIAFYLNDSPT